MSFIMRDNDITMYDSMDMADVNYAKGKFAIRNFSVKNLYFYWNNGRVFACDKKGRNKEFIYVHFQKRELLLKNGNSWNIGSELYIVAPNYVGNRDLINRRYFISELNFSIKYQMKRISRKLKKK